MNKTASRKRDFSPRRGDLFLTGNVSRQQQDRADQWRIFPGGAVISIMLLLLSTLPVYASGPEILFRENFDNLAQWEPLTFPKIKAHSTYTLVKEGGRSVLKAESRASASGLVCRRTFDIYAYPRLKWRWKVTHLADRGNPKEKAGDDYPIRVYVMFQYDPARATLGERIVYNATKALYDKYPPPQYPQLCLDGPKHPRALHRQPLYG